MRAEITPVFVETVPEELEDGVLYISIRYGTSAHKCACGCGMKVVAPLHPTAWEMHWNGRTVSLSPSIGNWQLPCRSHYLIRENRIVKARDLSGGEIERGRRREREKRSVWLRRHAQQAAGEAGKSARARPGRRGRRRSGRFPRTGAGFRAAFCVI